MPKDICKGRSLKSRNTQHCSKLEEKCERNSFFSLSLSLRSVERQRPKKGARPWHYEAFTSDRLEIIRPVTSHNTKIMTVFTPTLSLPLFSPSPSHSSSSLTFFCFYCYHCQRGLRKLPEFLSSYLPPPSSPLRQRKPPSRYPRRFSLSFAPQKKIFSFAVFFIRSFFFSFPSSPFLFFSFFAPGGEEVFP